MRIFHGSDGRFVYRILSIWKTSAHKASFLRNPSDRIICRKSKGNQIAWQNYLSILSIPNRISLFVKQNRRLSWRNLTMIWCTYRKNKSGLNLLTFIGSAFSVFHNQSFKANWSRFIDPFYLLGIFPLPDQSSYQIQLAGDQPGVALVYSLPFLNKSNF